MATTTNSLSARERDAWDAEGYVLLRGFATPGVCDAMLARATEMLGPDGRGGEGAATVLPVQADPMFSAFAHDDHVLGVLDGLVGPAVDVVLSRFVLTQPGAYGPPWHQDSADLPAGVSGLGRQVGVCLAVTEATLDSGCMWVVPGSHTEPVLDHLPDRRPDSPLDYVGVVEPDVQAAVPVPMDPGDVLVFDGHLLHRSTDNHSQFVRAAVVSHYGPVAPVAPG
jgi:hypothetical protein